MVHNKRWFYGFILLFLGEYAFVKVNRVFYNTVNYNNTIRSFIYYTDWKRTVWSEKNY